MADIVARTAVADVVANSPDEDVVPHTAHDDVVAPPADDLVVAVTAHDSAVPTATADVIVALGTADVRGDHHVRRDPDCVVARTATDVDQADGARRESLIFTRGRNGNLDGVGVRHPNANHVVARSADHRHDPGSQGDGRHRAIIEGFNLRAEIRVHRITFAEGEQWLKCWFVVEHPQSAGILRLERSRRKKLLKKLEDLPTNCRQGESGSHDPGIPRKQFEKSV